MMPIRFAVLGCGRMGRVHATRLGADARATIVAVSDVDRLAAERLRNELAPEAAVCESLAALWSRDDVDALLLATPTSLHFEHVVEARQRGWGLLCEKPLADTRKRTAELIRLLENDGGPPCSIAYQRRSWAIYRTLRREVLSGRWGTVRAIASHSSERWQQTIGGTWRDDPAVNPGGFVGDAGSHKLDALFYASGLELAEVFARSWKYGSRVEVMTNVSAVTTNDVPVTMDFVGNAQHLGEDLHIHCEHADLMIRDMRVWIARDNQVEPVSPLEPESNPVEAFLDLLEERCENQAPASCAWPVFQATEAILESAATGKPVKLDR
ncbi:MAG: Gfo/Idh/MocA family oxidoreductase [Planctomycetaceae bacterium]|nr:Gfo/Idh/MocA family oxidoreductase [Planctomycetaceae bacterium]